MRLRTLFIPLLITLSTLSLLPTISFAEVRPQGIEASVFTGYWGGDVHVDNGTFTGLSFGYHINRLISLDATYGLVPTRASESADEVSAALSTRSDVLIQQGALSALLNLSASRLTPFMRLGVGFVDVEDDLGAATVLGIGGRYYIDGALAIRAGLDMWIAPNLLLKRDRYEHFTATIGFTYSYGGDRDVDQDGIPNVKDRCPTMKEDMDDFQDKDGCPELDNDEDGIKDKEDKCPDEAEDKDEDRDDDGCPDLDDDEDGVPNAEDQCKDEPEDKDDFMDEDGCPDKDNDEDGILDVDDQCPKKAETKNGFKDEDGCPELDQDKDGVFDSDDQCKAKPEVYNGVEDQDGCPDAVPEELSKAITMLPLQYKGDRKVFTRSRKVGKVLESIAKSLTESKMKVRVQVGGMKGKDPALLSKARALYIIDSLVELGVPKEQLKAEGLGSADYPSDVEGSKKKGTWVGLRPLINDPRQKNNTSKK